MIGLRLILLFGVLLCVSNAANDFDVIQEDGELCFTPEEYRDALIETLEISKSEATAIVEQALNPVRSRSFWGAVWGAAKITFKAYRVFKTFKRIQNIKLAIPQTPIHEWKLPNVPPGYSVHIKRDDVTGSTLSGNKVRKLEFIFGKALSEGYKHIITCGGVQSNHCRATAIACSQLGLKCHLFLRGDIKKPEQLPVKGNVFLDMMAGAHIYLIPKTEQYATGIKPKMEQLAKKILNETGETSYLMEVGGSNETGLFGYLDAFNELHQQDVSKDYSDIVFACGSGGTAEGLGVGNQLTQSNLGIHGMTVSDDAAYFHNHANNLFNTIAFNKRSQDVLDFVEGHKGAGYGKYTQEDLDFITEVCRTTGIILDPVYTGKAVRGMLSELRNNPQRFKGKKILYIHTGGMFGAMDGSLDETLAQYYKQNNRVHIWDDWAKAKL